MYIGMTGDGPSASLRTRIRALVRYGTGHNIEDAGGRALWQLPSSGDLVVCWRRTKDGVEAVSHVTTLWLQAFADRASRLDRRRVPGDAGASAPRYLDQVPDREYADEDAERLRLLVGLRQLDLPLTVAAKLATMCADGRCGEVSDELRAAIPAERSKVRRRIRELRHVDERLALLEHELQTGQRPSDLIGLEPRKEDV